MRGARHAGKFLVLIALAVVSATASPQRAQSTDGGTLTRDQAEARLTRLQEEIADLRAALDEARSEHRREQEELRNLDLEVNGTSREVRTLEAAQAEHRAELERLEAEQQAQLATLGQRQDQLAEVLRSAYRLDRHSRLKLVLNQDNPTTLNHMLAYYEYFNRRHIENISTLRESLALLEQTHLRISHELASLQSVRERLENTLERLTAQRSDRLGLIAELDARIGNDEAQLRELDQNRQDLVSLLERLENALADIPADLGERLGVAQQKGHLPMPTPGPVQHAFGQRRAGSLYWQGWLIGVEPGTEVHPVAYGRVAFADWLRGYGLMLIIDHGDGFLSLYGNNESLLAEVGDWVEPVEPIGVVGSNPGMSQGLYFELRKDGKAVDPAAWIDR